MQPMLGLGGDLDDRGLELLLSLLQGAASPWPMSVKHAASKRTRRTWALPLLVMAPWRRRLPLESSPGTTPQYAMSLGGRSNRENCPISTARVVAVIFATPRNACSPSMSARRAAGAA